jgi:tartrate-resistant acid phosphatase type 5
MFNSRCLQLLWGGLFFSITPFVYAAPKTDSIPGLVVMDSSIHFLVVGDWGRRGSFSQRKVAAAMSVAGQQLGISFIISTGDNFYPSGVADVKDSHWIYSFEQVYDAPSLQCRWMVVLGNHDYSASPQAEVDYTYKSERWFMPARYYDTTMAIGKDSMLLVFLDTEPIEMQLRGLPADTNKYSPGYVDQQLVWLKKTLGASTAKWKIVVGHHPLHTGGTMRHNTRVIKLRNLLQPIFNTNKVNFYLSGHEHHLEYLKPKGPTHYIISGTGSSTDHVGWLKRYRRFAARKEGFVSMSVSSKGWVIQFISDKETVLYKHSL